MFFSSLWKMVWSHSCIMKQSWVKIYSCAQHTWRRWSAASPVVSTSCLKKDRRMKMKLPDPSGGDQRPQQGGHLHNSSFRGVSLLQPGRTSLRLHQTCNHCNTHSNTETWEGHPETLPGKILCSVLTCVCRNWSCCFLKEIFLDITIFSFTAQLINIFGVQAQMARQGSVFVPVHHHCDVPRPK